MDNTYSRSYNGNPLLKGRGVPIQWEPWMVEEYEKCAKDPVYFAANYVKIVTEKGLIPFVMRDYQEEMVRSFVSNRWNMALMARQSGKTETVRAFILHYILFNKEKTVALLANKGETAREILGKIQIAYQHLPKWMQQGVIGFHKGSFTLENGSRVIAAATSSSAIRGYTIQCLVIDEAAFVERWDDFYSSVMPTVIEGQETKLIMCSTPNGLNHYHKLWVESEQGKNPFNRFYVPWHRVPGRDEKWKQETLAVMGNDIERFNQEMEIEFLGSSGTLIAGWKLKELVSKTPIEQHDGLYQYQKPIEGHRYAITVDTSHGKGLDYSAFHVIDVTTMPYEQVCAFYSNRITPADYASFASSIGRIYNNALMLVEVNEVGVQVADTIQYDLEYENLLYTATYGNQRRIVSGFGASKIEKGIRTTKPVKATGCAVLKLLVEQNQLIINHKQTIDELCTFSKKGASYEAEEGKHDDLVMALVIFAWMTTQQYFKDHTDVNTINELRDLSIDEIQQEMLPFGAIDCGESMEDPPSTVDMVERPETYFNF